MLIPTVKDPHQSETSMKDEGNRQQARRVVQLTLMIACGLIAANPLQAQDGVYRVSVELDEYDSEGFEVADDSYQEAGGGEAEAEELGDGATGGYGDSAQAPGGGAGYGEAQGDAAMGATGGMAGGMEGTGGMAGGMEAAKPGLPSLAEMLQHAFSNNPDIQVAQARVRESEAQLNKTRLEVVQKVMALRQSWRAHRGKLQEAKHSLEQARHHLKGRERLHSKGVLSEEELQLAKLELKVAESALLDAESQLAETEAGAAYLLGRQSVPTVMGMGYPGGMMDMEMSGWDVGIEIEAPEGSRAGGGGGYGEEAEEGAQDDLEEYGGGYGGDGGVGDEPYQSPGQNAVRVPTTTTVPVAERTSRALKDQTTIEFIDVPVEDGMEFIGELHDINILVDNAAFADSKTPVRITFKMEDLSLGAALQALEDTHNLRFWMRDYGILVTPRSGGVDDGVTVRQFLKQQQAGMYGGGYGLPGISGGYGGYGSGAGGYGIESGYSDTDEDYGAGYEDEEGGYGAEGIEEGGYGPDGLGEPPQ